MLPSLKGAQVEGLDYWRLCHELSVIQAALLIVGEDPAGTEHLVLEWKPENRPTGFDGTFAALKHAINGKGLPATVRRQSWERGWNEDPDEGENVRCADTRGRQIIYKANPDWDLTTVTVDDLRRWLVSRGLRTGFFFPQASEGPDYLEPSHPRYAPKLAAAVRAWGSVTELAGKPPKQALVKWLREHAAEYELTDEEGNPNQTGIEEIAKVANWKPAGGAPRTLG